MRKFILIGACSVFVAISVLAAHAEPSGGSPENQRPSTNDADHVEPGKVGPGSEKNSEVSPTSPDIPVHKQPPPDINLPAHSNEAGGASGGGERKSGTDGPPAEKAR